MPEPTDEPALEQDARGRVHFDSTQRPIRLVFGGFFLLVGWAMGLFLLLAEDAVGAFEYFFVGGWTTLALAATGLVYEVVLDKRDGTALVTAGWFLLVWRRRTQLRDYQRVVLTTLREPVRDRRRVEEPRFSVELVGATRLNLQVGQSAARARRSAEAVAAWLGLPLDSDVT